MGFYPPALALCLFLPVAMLLCYILGLIYIKKIGKNKNNPYNEIQFFSSKARQYAVMQYPRILGGFSPTCIGHQDSGTLSNMNDRRF
uniref:Putative secreted protein n=1 Tax=Anopheles darlingi TaxID=43151 RepID=A0A2M4DCS9_ANODA